MKLESAIHSVDTNLQPLNPLRIKTTAMAFQVLSSRIYSNKIQSILRELCTNAVDGHVAGGCADVPFEVKLPNALDREFYVKDFGIGLTHEEVMDLYLTYFSSNKQETNDQVGAFGLGSKSPLAYTDTFSVVSAKDGVENSYVVYVGEDGIPVPSRVSTKPASSDYPHGVTVSFAVQPGDFGAFETAAQRVLPWFAITPTVKGILPQAVERPRELASAGCLHHYEITVGYQAGKFIKMGPVLYPLDETRLGASHRDRLRVACILLGNTASKQLIPHDNTANQLYILDAPLGAVSVATSREMLEYTKPTVAALESIIDAMWNTLFETVVSKADALLCHWTWPGILDFSMELMMNREFVTRHKTVGALFSTDQRFNAVYAVQDRLLQKGLSGALVILPEQQKKRRTCSYHTAFDGKSSLLACARLNAEWCLADMPPGKNKQAGRARVLQTGNPVILVDKLDANAAALLTAAGNPALRPISDFASLIKQPVKTGPTLPKGSRSYRVKGYQVHNRGYASAEFTIQESDSLGVETIFVVNDKSERATFDYKIKPWLPILNLLAQEVIRILMVNKAQHKKVVGQGALSLEALVSTKLDACRKLPLADQVPVLLSPNPLSATLIRALLQTSQPCIDWTTDARLLLPHLKGTRFHALISEGFEAGRRLVAIPASLDEQLRDPKGAGLPARWSSATMLQGAIRKQYPLLWDAMLASYNAGQTLIHKAANQPQYRANLLSYIQASEQAVHLDVS